MFPNLIKKFFLIMKLYIIISNIVHTKHWAPLQSILKISIKGKVFCSWSKTKKMNEMSEKIWDSVGTFFFVAANLIVTSKGKKKNYSDTKRKMTIQVLKFSTCIHLIKSMKNTANMYLSGEEEINVNLSVKCMDSL